ncbi:MAG: hypothetical protein ACR2OM_04075 [Aestuariivirgaceae bacterium]
MVFVVAAAITLLAVLLTGPAVDLWTLALVLIALFCGFALAIQFSSLSVEVDETELRWWFGLGLWRKSVRRADIASAQAVRNSWWWGWGIRYYGKGWLYNVSGLDAVEIVLKSGKHIRIGTDDPQGLADALTDQAEWR